MNGLAPRGWPVRVRLVAGFAFVMVAVLATAGAFVYWRVEVALDRTLNESLRGQASSMQRAWETHLGSPTDVVRALPADTLGQVLNSSGGTLAATPGAAALTLLPGSQVELATNGPVELAPGNLLTGGSKRLRGVAFPLPSISGGAPAIAVTAVRLRQRDEALRELLAQLTIANLLALAAAALVGYRLARATLLPVERYRLRAEQITRGASGVRLDVPSGIDDEISRLGHTLNQMLSVQEQAAERQRQFIADASHELRAPLTVLTTEVELALRRPRTAEQYQETLQQVAVDAARLVTLAEQLLDLEQTQARRSLGTPSASTDDLDAAGQRAAARARAQLTGTARVVTCSEPEAVTSGPPRLLALGAFSLDQILGNLVDNAVLHGAGNIAVAVTSVDRWLVISVSDEGQGPPADFVPDAVERFRRADQARTTPGNGLGLALVNALAQQGGGELRLCTAQRHHRYPPVCSGAPPCGHASSGTTASVVLPLRQAATACGDARSRRASAP